MYREIEVMCSSSYIISHIYLVSNNSSKILILKIVSSRHSSCYSSLVMSVSISKDWFLCFISDLESTKKRKTNERKKIQIGHTIVECSLNKTNKKSLFNEFPRELGLACSAIQFYLCPLCGNHSTCCLCSSESEKKQKSSIENENCMKTNTM